MARCLELAAQAEGRTAPNPLVGSVIVDAGGIIVAEGYHKKAGMLHAEAEALQIAGDRARGATLYVNLEPCSHHGRTPPCAEAIVKAGIKKVVAAIADPNPKVAGSGFDLLREHGIEVVLGPLQEEALWLNRGFLKVQTKKLPWLTLKMAATLDGRIADRQGRSKWITGEGARHMVQELRNRFDCVLVGAGTVKADNPRLNVRELESSDCRDPKKVIIDPHLSLDPSYHVLKSEGESKTIVYHRPGAEPGDQYADCDLVPADIDEDGRVDSRKLLRDLTSRGINTVLCEGGGKLAANLLLKDLVDEIYWFTAPKLLPDAGAVLSTNSAEELAMADILNYELLESKRTGEDVLIHLRRKDYKRDAGSMP